MSNLSHLDTLISQLQYAVDRCRGKTTITELDLSVLRDALRQLKEK